MALDRTALEETVSNTLAKLLACRRAEGWWEGRLSSSALSTATSLFALELAGKNSGGAPHRRLVEGGIRWLVEHQNADGGWGDTVLSISNISTTALCWAALSAGGDGAVLAAGKAEEYLARIAGGLAPAALAKAIAARYGKDRTFSVPILTMLALAGRLGKGREAWKYVPQLPFELAAFPHTWFAFLRLPVVSYALPALIAIGQVRHWHRPTRNPVMRVARYMTAPAATQVLEEIQPESGGFLEAAPLTSFVLMSLAAAGQGDGAVAQRAVEFLVRSVREDGSWPIDTNLATWLTTLSVNAICQSAASAAMLGEADRQRIADWLLKQQYRCEHPYTHAAPGGWAWTDLSGGVPDADDTAGALVALRNLGFLDERVLEAAGAGVQWLLDLQNRDGGLPTFCRGWGALPFDRSGQDLTAHAVMAWSAWHDVLATEMAARIHYALERALRYLAERQRPDGAWVPLWFGNQFAEGEENPTYGTARVMIALCAADSRQYGGLEGLRSRGRRWILNNQNEDGGWGGGSGTGSSIEETALAVQALGIAEKVLPEAEGREAMERGVKWLIERTGRGQRFEASPIGFYFAKLWYFEELYPLIFAAGAMGSVGGRE